ncbi:hypothetical protein MOV61_26610 [Neorhizobium sp. BETTINA12A]|uniref:hypothetical protein n=1 Tax=unclassified Neorhizobium TaxID=2629175 RepID=UPI001FF6B45E|nr:MULTISPECIES: hypothetical protein [unclassified Neorhizobium]MCJ9674742.1 hypothetical protein [Neorhizobium sp. SHOUNA12B]MCJ9748903.1 hypothetical protein [Neorhizobium sp. SHOUNA12A]MCJ9754307.1 hypothetical protein [Neorhizobium sp. BETTINA12A]
MPDGKILPIDELFQPLPAKTPAASQYSLAEAVFGADHGLSSDEILCTAASVLVI